MKTCTKCKSEKTVDSFHKDKSRSDGLRPWCKECSLEHGRKWFKENPEKQAAARRRWDSNSRDKKRIHWQRYKANKVGAAQGFIPTLDEMKELYGDTCMYPECTRKDIEIDHVVPLSKGGAHDISNFQLLCKSHNCSKGNRTEADYR